VNELPALLGTAERTQTPGTSCCRVASTRLAAVSATPVLVTLDDPAATGPTDQEQAPDSGTPATTPSDPGPTVTAITDDGHKTTPTAPGKTTAPKKNPLTQLTDSVKKFFSPKKKPAPSSTPGSDPAGSTPGESPSQTSTGDAA